jgi:hypothetical protein
VNYYLLFSGASAHFQIWKERLCQIKNGNKIRKKKEQEKKERGMMLTVGDDAGGCCFQGLVHISKYRK